MDLLHTHVLRPIRSVVATVFPKKKLMRYSHEYAKKRYLDY